MACPRPGVVRGNLLWFGACPRPGVVRGTLLLMTTRPGESNALHAERNGELAAMMEVVGHPHICHWHAPKHPIGSLPHHLFLLYSSYLPYRRKELKEFTMEEMLRATLASYEKDLVAFTKALIAIPTENPPGAAYRACVELLTQKLAEIGLAYTLLESQIGRAHV